VKPQAHKAATLFECLYDIIRSKGYLKTEYKQKIYKSDTGRVLTYAAEAITRQIVVTKQMNTRRKVIGKTSLDLVRKLVIRGKYGIQPMGDWMNKRRGEWNKKHSTKTENRLYRSSEITYEFAEETQKDIVSDGMTLSLSA
jgi:hypothetical protein